MQAIALDSRDHRPVQGMMPALVRPVINRFLDVDRNAGGSYGWNCAWIDFLPSSANRGMTLYAGRQFRWNFLMLSLTDYCES